MRKIVILLFVTLLAAQSAFAAAARYCGHEGGASSSQHFGHHEHDHGSSAPVERSDPNAPDLDCAFCQFGGTQSLAALAIAPDLRATHPPAVAGPRPVVSALHDDLLRPPRPRSA
ncbi:MAG: hypothetical protein ACKVQT_23865 [Burkholderiales bacterium]